METWELWFPAAAANGLLVARSRIDPTSVVWAHSAPVTLSVVVREGEDRILARGDSLERDGPYFPMTRLQRDGASIRREDRWPNDSDLGAVVILPGGQAAR